MRDSAKNRACFRHFHPITTRWSDNDAYGHVNNVIYYHWFDTVVNQFLQDFGYIAAFGASGVKLSITISAGTAFAKAIIAVFIQDSFSVEHSEIPSSVSVIFSSFEYNWFDALLNQLQCCEESSRARPNNDCAVSGISYIREVNIRIL